MVAADLADRDFQRHEVDVESALIIFAGIVERQQVEDRPNVRIEPIVALPGERDVAAAQRRDHLARVPIQVSKRQRAVSSRLLPIVIPVVEPRGRALVVRRDDAGAQYPARARAMIHLRDGVRLHEVLRGVIHVRDDAGVVVERRVRVLGSARELELITQRRPACGAVRAQRHMNLVQHVVIKVELVRADARLLKRIDAECDDERLDLIDPLIHDERVHVGGVGRRVEHDQRRILVAGRHQRVARQSQRCDGCSDAQHVTHFVHGASPFG